MICRCVDLSSDSLSHIPSFTLPLTPLRPHRTNPGVPPRHLPKQYHLHTTTTTRGWPGPLSHLTPPPRRTNNTHTHLLMPPKQCNPRLTPTHGPLTHLRRAPCSHYLLPSPYPYYILDVVPPRCKQCVGSEARGPGNICWAAVSVLLHK